MLKKIRVILALFFFIAVAALFLDFTGTVHAYLGWCARVQLVPALLATQLAIVLGIIFLTLILGRVYCSAICPLGVFQDIISRLRLKKNRFSYRPPRKALVVLRYVLIAVFILPLLFGKGGLVNLLDPYSMFGRMVSQIFGPVYKYGNNLLAYFAERADSYAFYTTDIWLRGSTMLVLAILTFVAVVSFAYKSGRGYCNSICPVGAFLGLISKYYSLLKPRIDKEKCKHCGICAKNCKAGCIDPSTLEIDGFRCVACFNCIESCPSGSIKYTSPKLPDKLTAEGQTRRGIMVGTALLASSFATRAAANEFDGGLARLEDKKAPQQRTKPIVPAGAISWKNFHDRCTGCSLCVSVCPNQVLSPLKTKPIMFFERGYCRPECVKCSEVCPTGAISPITREEKTSIQIGVAVWKSDLCVINAKKDNCDLCLRKCPAGAITADPDSKTPIIDTSRCTGCGACEHHCPSRPYSAIYVDGVEVHRDI